MGRNHKNNVKDWYKADLMQCHCDGNVGCSDGDKQLKSADKSKHMSARTITNTK